MMVRPRLEKSDRFGLFDRGNLSQSPQYRFWYLPVDMDDGDGLPRLIGFFVRAAASEREIRDIDRFLAEDGSQFSNDAGNITVSHVDQVALKRRLDINAIDMQNARSFAMQHGAFDQVLLGCALKEDR